MQRWGLVSVGLLALAGCATSIERSSDGTSAARTAAELKVVWVVERSWKLLDALEAAFDIEDEQRADDVQAERENVAGQLPEKMEPLLTPEARAAGPYSKAWNAVLDEVLRRYAPGLLDRVREGRSHGASEETWLSLAKLWSELRSLLADEGEYPSTETGLDGLLYWSAERPELYAAIVKHSMDDWGRDLRYERTSAGYRLRSAGADGAFGTVDDLQVTESDGGYYAQFYERR